MIDIHDLEPDERLSHVSKALDPVAMQEALQSTMFTGQAGQEGYRIRFCELRDVRYKRGRYCTALYRVLLGKDRQESEFEQWVYGRMFPSGQSSRRYAAARNAPLAIPSAGNPVWHIPELEMCCWGFPNDRTLITLPDALNRQTLLTQILPALIETSHGPGWAIDTLEQEIVQYVPEHSCTARITLHLFRPPSGNVKRVRLYAKVYDHERGTQMLDRLTQIWNEAQKAGNRFHIPRPVWYDTVRKTMWQEPFKGELLGSHDWRDPRMPHWYANAGSAVADVHRMRLTGLSSTHLDGLLQALHEHASLIKGMRPSCRSRLDELVTILYSQLRALRPPPLVPLHGDLHRKNLYVLDDTIGLIDWDSAILGPPLHDVGSFIARLYYPVAIGEIEESTARNLVAAFLETYRREVPWPVPPLDVAWHTTVNLVSQQAYSCATRFRSGSLETVDRLVAEALDLIRHPHDQGIVSRNSTVSASLCAGAKR